MPFRDLDRVLRVLEAGFRAAAGEPGAPEQHAQVLRAERNPVLLRQPFGPLRQGPGAVLRRQARVERLQGGGGQAARPAAMGLVGKPMAAAGVVPSSTARVTP